MILTLFAPLTHVNWIVGLYNYGVLVNEGICLILVIQTFVVGVVYVPAAMLIALTDISLTDMFVNIY